MWKQEKLLSEDEPISAIFALKSDPIKLAALEKDFWEISDPKNSRYGKYYTFDQVKEKLSAPNASIEKVVSYLKSQGVENVQVSRIGDKIRVAMPAKIASQMFNTEFAQFRSIANERVTVNRVTKPYHLPSELVDVVSFVDDIVRFPSVRSQLVVPLENNEKTTADSEFNSCGTVCPAYTTPAVLETAYSFTTLSSSAAGNSVSVAEFQGQYWDQTDLDDFNSACNVEGSVTTTIGGNNPSACSITGCTEAMLDIEYIAAITNPIPLTVLYSSTYSLLDWVDSLIAMTNPPWVNSVSYGNDEVQQTSTQYMETCNTQFQAAGVLGLSLLFASGDQGVWGRTGYSKTATFHPDFPAASPYITAVGGTNFVTKSTIGPEAAWSCGGGGFSNTFSIPSYQASYVQSYLTNAAAQGVLPDSKYFNSSGRAYPDVAALGGQTNPYCVSYRSGKFGGVAGTSASCPVVAGIFAQLNNVRFNNGQSAMGFLNPFIYQNGDCFNDVTTGENNCQSGTPGFYAIEGWDPATGFGSPNYACLETRI
eukprot:CAMPEP_0202970916 /NCGR_PEP_ID=MMETSP1396-20130829/21755_1 /ASSEMBLY_ACC=CAM_ASM_000872 /TAXON_ID= /ORGANISM="Pseudokeronopsis sp., Strain Brazil" /LENGTH=535 /DNA_ID=CAMNT_0049699783 /DNA_START=129 /DNA_END=1736 /DNA_ORIENTATION=+